MKSKNIYEDWKKIILDQKIPEEFLKVYKFFEKPYFEETEASMNYKFDNKIILAFITAFNKLCKKSHLLEALILIVSFSIKLLFHVGTLFINCLNAFKFYSNSIYLPVYEDLTKKDIQTIVDSLDNVLS